MNKTSPNIKFIVSTIYDFFLGLIDNPITKSLAFALWAIPIYFYLLPFFGGLKLTSSDYNNITQFIEWFGVPYGLLLALVLVNVWTQFDTVDRSFDREVDAIVNLPNLVPLISRPRHGEVQTGGVVSPVMPHADG
jgi:hypothetical protein